MSAPFRIYKDPPRPAAAAATVEEDSAQVAKYFRNRLDQLVRLVPAEIVALYVGGTAVIGKPDGDPLYPWFHFGWWLICLVLLFPVRRWGNREKPDERTQWMPIIVSAGAFLVWVYYLRGGPCVEWPQIYHQTVASLVVLLYTFGVSFLPKDFLQAAERPADGDS